MTRSEEELRVGKTEREAGRARLRKYVVTEDVQQTVPVKREEVRVEREPITDANVGRATDGPGDLRGGARGRAPRGGGRAEKRAVPKERVRLDKDVEVEERPSTSGPRRRSRSTTPAAATAVRGTIAAPEGRPCAGPRREGRSRVGAAMRAMFITYLVVIVAGLVYFTVIGLTHH